MLFTCRLATENIFVSPRLRRPYDGDMNQPSATPFYLHEFLTGEAIKLNLAGSQRDEVLNELIDLIPALAAQPASKEKLFRALQERELLHSTGIGDGIALPHARNALVGLVDKPVIVFGRHPTGIPYGAVDNEPARLFFLLVATNVSQHLQILARISRLLRDSRLRRDLLQADKPETVIALITKAETEG